MSELIRGERPALTRPERALRGAGLLLAAVSAYFAYQYLRKGFGEGAEYPYLVNSVAKDFLLAALGLLVYWDVRRFAAIAVPIIVTAHVLMPVLLLLQRWLVDSNAIGATWMEGSPETFRWTWIGGDVFMIGLFTVTHFLAVRSRYDLRYLPPSAFRALMALAEVLVLRKDPEVAPAEVAGRVDHYLASFKAREKAKMRLALVGLALWPMLMLRPPFWVMSVDARQDWVRRRFVDEVDARLTPAVVRRYRRAMIRVAQQLCFLGYYGEPRAAAKADYVPYSKREGARRPPAAVNGHARPRRLRTMAPSDVDGRELVTGTVIVGTGAAGSVLAHELAARGREVLMLERGAHVDPSQFTEDEATQLSNLYADGALTLSRDFRFQVAQGMCVGGTTVVNNAVCFDLPERVLDRWLDPRGLDAGLDPHRLLAAFARVRRLLGVSQAGPPASLSPGARRLLDGLEGQSRWRFAPVEINVAACIGCGYCNIGCAYGRKLSALDWILPMAQQQRRGKVDLLPDCRVERVLLRDGRAYGVRCRLADGRELTVRADTVVLSAGALASSVILQRSGLGRPQVGPRPGDNLSFNMGSPVTLDFPEKVHAERGLQITHYLDPSDGEFDRAVLETWFNPIVSQSLFMPGWFEEHWENMRRYAYMTSLGVVVGTASNGSVRAKGRHGLELKYTPTNRDFAKLKDGLRLACEVGLAAGARRALPATFRMLEIRSSQDLHRIDEHIGDTGDVSVNSAHPQGGNPVSADPLKGVVDPTFRVYGTVGLHVCDASVFPSSITVNPQLTVMALAAYAADEIAPGPQPGGERLQGLASGPGS